MNAFGQRLVDDFDAPELAPVRQAFLDGAHFIYGHTVLQRALGLGYQSQWAQTQSAHTARAQPVLRESRNAVVLPGIPGLDQLNRCDPAMAPIGTLTRCGV